MADRQTDRQRWERGEIGSRVIKKTLYKEEVGWEGKKEMQEWIHICNKFMHRQTEETKRMPC